jgi:hypothetical protein
MPTQILYELMNWGSTALVLGAIVVGVVLTKAAVRKLLTDEPTDTWRQPESSPDPRLLAD